MNIRNRLTFLFILIVAIIMTLSSVAIYLSSANHRKDDFNNRLLNKASSTAKLLIEVEEIDSELLKRIEKDNPTSLPKEKIIIYNYLNEILYSTDDENIIHVDKNLLDEIRLKGRKEFAQNEHEVLGFLFTDRYDRFIVIAAAEDIYGLRKLQNLRNILIIVFCGGIVLVTLAGWVYSARALRPISKVVNQVGEITIAKLDHRVDEGENKDEIALLAQTFNKMLDRLEASFKVQKNFIANASHELRTPLTAITGQLEVTLLNARSNEEYKQTIESVLEDIKKLNRLSNRLLLLAQTSTDEANHSFAAIRIDDLLWQCKDELIKRNLNYIINIDFDPALDDEQKLTIAGDAQLVKVAFSNLMDNGCKYTPNKQVDIWVNYIKGHIIIQFKDQGIGIVDEDLHKIFEPFHRGRNTQNISGHGIGLSLVERIVRSHKGKIEIVSKPNAGSTFTVTFPTLYS
jgi:signal transduction histidine kinase